MIECFPLPRGSYWQSSRYGEPRANGPHRGIDYAAPQGTPLHAPVSGRVTVPAPEPNGAGRNIWITGADNVTWKFFHMDRIEVTGGQTVTAGQRVGTVGSTGRSSGPHLHIEKHTNWPPTNRVDPTADLANSRRFPGSPPSSTTPEPPPAPTRPKEMKWMGKAIAINGETAQYRLVDDGYGVLRRQHIVDVSRLAVLNRCGVVEGELVILTDSDEIAAFRAIPEANPQPQDVGALRLSANVIAEIRAATERVLGSHAGGTAAAIGTDPAQLVDLLVDELADRLRA